MIAAEVAARYLVYLASQGDEPSPITHLQLQKLLYYAQGTHLAMVGRELFASKIEAWTHGPVVPDLYPVFADFGSNPIPPHCGRDDATMSEEDRATLDRTWQTYGRFSAWHLREKTHREPPWRDARKSLPAGAASKATIGVESMRAFFGALAEQQAKKFPPATGPLVPLR